MARPPAVEPAVEPLVETPLATPYVGRRSAAVDSTVVFGDLEVTAEIPLPRPPAAGRRRATRATGRDVARSPLVRALPSPPLLIGVATLAVAVGGVLTSTGPALVDHQTPAVRQAGALTGTSSIASSTGLRSPDLSRSSSRQALSQTTGTDAPAATADLEQHNTALTQLAQKAEHQATKLNNNRWVLPIDRGVYHLTARFGDTGLWESFHTGLDFACPTGTPIHAIASGIVTFAGYDGAYGNKTVITLPDGTELWFGHQTTQLVQVGDTVTRGQIIGTVGSTGHVTGPHVHIEVRPGGGDPVDPFPAFVVHGVTP